MSTPEGKVKDKIKKLLKKFGVYYHMPVMNGMGAPTLDFICCCDGRFVAIEAKAPGKHATERQKETMKTMEDAGAFVFEVATDEDLAILEAYLQLMTP